MVLLGDARRIGLKDRSVQCVVCSPPYWALVDYEVEGQLGLERTPADYVAAMVEVFREVRRVLKDDGTLWLVLGDSYSKAGSAHRDPERWPKQRSRRFVPRIKEQSGAKEKDLLLISMRVADALQRDGWYLRADIVWYRPNSMPENVRDRPMQSHNHVFLLTKQPDYLYDRKAIPWKRNVWTISNEPRHDGNHFAAFPTKLVEPCILAGSKPGDLIFDPFIGSGTTGLVAEQLGRRWVGMDLNPQYAAHVNREARARRWARFARRFTNAEILEVLGCETAA